MKPSLLLFVFTIISSIQSASAEVLDFSIHPGYTSVRALGMGNAFSAVVDDHSAIYYNPAALARREDGLMRYYIKGAFSDGWDSLWKSLSSENSSDIANSLADNSGSHYYMNFPSMGFSWVRPNWAVSFIPLDFSNTWSIHNQLGPSLGVNLYADSTFAYSYARDLKFNFLGNGDVLSAGVTAKVIHRIYFSDAIDAATLASSSPMSLDRASEGLTFDTDWALLYSPQISETGFFSFLKYTEPTFSLVVRNLLDMGYPVQLNVVSKLEEVPKPPDLQRRIDFGTKYDLPNFWVFNPKIAFEFRDILHDNWSTLKGFHAGAELEWEMFSWWRGTWSLGVNQGYYTAGFGGKFGIFQLDLATWGEEVGTTDARQENRRYVMEMSLDF